MPDHDVNDDGGDNVTHENITADGVMRNDQIAGVGTSSTSLIHQESRPTAVCVLRRRKQRALLQSDKSFVNRSVENNRPNSPSVLSTRPKEKLKY